MSALKAKSEITIYNVIEKFLKSTTRYYLSQSSTSNYPSKPTTNPPSSGWSKTEPAFQNGSTNTLYFVDLFVYSDDAFVYSDVSKSSSFEASKEALNKANNAQSTANNAKNKIDNLSIGGRNLIRYGKGDIQKGFFEKFTLNSDGFLEVILKSNGNHNAKSLKNAFVIQQREYPVGETYIWSYDFMYTKWDFPEGSSLDALWVGQRYTNAPSGESSSGQWARITAHNLPTISKDNLELNTWYHHEQIITIPKQASENVGADAQFEFYNKNSSVTATIAIRFKNVKLEHGNIATDWTPASEDAYEQIDNLGDKVNYMTNGGINLLPRTKFLNKGCYAKLLTDSTYNDFAIASGTCLSTSKTYTDILAYYNAFTPKPNTYYTLSFYAKANVDGFVLASYIYPDATVRINAPDGNISGGFSNSGDGLSENILTTEWKRYWVKWKTSNSISGVKNILIGRLQGDKQTTTEAKTATVYICAPKLEENVLNSDWTPAPGDYEYDVKNLEDVTEKHASQISQNKDNISINSTKITEVENSMKVYNNAQLKISEDITSTVSRVTKLETNTKNQVYWSAFGDNTKLGAIVFAKLFITGAWCGSAISFKIISINKSSFDVILNVNHTSTTDPDIRSLYSNGNTVYANKTYTTIGEKQYTTFELMMKKEGGKNDKVTIADYAFDPSYTENIKYDSKYQTKILNSKKRSVLMWVDENCDNPSGVQSVLVSGNMTKEEITSEVKQTANGLEVKLNKLYHDANNYSQLNTSTAESFGFSYDNTADGIWYTPIKMARDLPISIAYECLGGEKFKIEYEISTSIKGSSTSGGTDQIYRGTTIMIVGYDDTNKPNAYLVGKTRVMGTEEADPVKVTDSITIPTKCRRFKVIIQTEGYGNWAGTLKIRNIVVSKLNAISDATSTAQSTANTARTEAANAAKTATNYLGFNQNGLTVGDLSSDVLGNNVNINSNSVDIRDGDNILASYGNDIKMYSNGKEALNITKNELILRALDENDNTILSKTYDYLKDSEEGKSIAPEAQVHSLPYFPFTWTINDNFNVSTETKYLLLLLKCNVDDSGANDSPYHEEIKYLLVPLTNSINIKTISWDSSRSNININTFNGKSQTIKRMANFITITNTNDIDEKFNFSLLDLNSVIEENIYGTMNIYNSSGINNEKTVVPLRIGDMIKNNLLLSYNTIRSESNRNEQNTLYIQPDGSPVIFNSDKVGIMIYNGMIYSGNQSSYTQLIGFEPDRYELYVGNDAQRINISPINQLNMHTKTLNMSYDSLIINGRGGSSIPYIQNYDGTWNSGFNNYNDNVDNRPMCTKYGNVVDFVGIASPSNDKVLAGGSNANLFTLPSDYRPSRDRVIMCQGSGRCIFTMWIRKTGLVEIGRYRDPASSSYPTSVSTNTYLAISATFMV